MRCRAQLMRFNKTGQNAIDHGVIQKPGGRQAPVFGSYFPAEQATPSIEIGTILRTNATRCLRACRRHFILFSKSHCHNHDVM